jgi:hypothetical protein
MPMRRPTPIDGSAPEHDRANGARARESHRRRGLQQGRGNALGAGHGVHDDRKERRVRDDHHRGRRAGAEPQDGERQDRNSRYGPEALDERIDVALDRAHVAHGEAERYGDERRDREAPKHASEALQDGHGEVAVGHHMHERSGDLRRQRHTRVLDRAADRLPQHEQRDGQDRTQRQAVCAVDHFDAAVSGAHGVSAMDSSRTARSHR